MLHSPRPSLRQPSKPCFLTYSSGALCGQVASRIEAIRSVSEIISETVHEFAESVERLGAQLPMN